MYWLSYGGGINSTALAILLIENKLPQYVPFRVLFSDTGNEKDETYNFIEKEFKPYLTKKGVRLEVVKPAETVLEQWQRLKVTGSRIIRSCTKNAKIKPINSYINENGGGQQLIGIDAGEWHRVRNDKNKHYPLVDLNIDRKKCVEIIRSAKLSIPTKSGCWCCPFSRVAEIINLAQSDPCKFSKIENLEKIANVTHGFLKNGMARNQWHDKPASYWKRRASQGDLFEDKFIEMPCDCYDG